MWYKCMWRVYSPMCDVCMHACMHANFMSLCTKSVAICRLCKHNTLSVYLSIYLSVYAYMIFSFVQTGGLVDRSGSSFDSSNGVQSDTLPAQER